MIKEEIPEETVSVKDLSLCEMDGCFNPSITIYCLDHLPKQEMVHWDSVRPDVGMGSFTGNFQEHSDQLRKFKKAKPSSKEPKISFFDKMKNKSLGDF